MKLNKKTRSNLITLLIIGIFIFPTSREWIQRQIAFIPSVDDVEDRPVLNTMNWILIEESGKRINFSSMKGEVIFVNFWATWCPPCRAELPYLQEFYDDYKDEVKFVFISSEDRATVDGFLEKEGYQLPTFQLGSAPPTYFQESNALPSSYIIDKQGRVAVFKTGAGRWSSSFFYRKLDRLINDPKP